MRLPSYRDRQRERESASMTPMIDVVFLLLIFFVCASIGQIREAILPTDISAGVSESQDILDEEEPRDEYWLVLRRVDDEENDGQRTVFEINNARFDDFETLRTLLTKLAAAARDDPIILDIEPEVPTGDMIRVWDTCRVAGFQTINFATDSAEPRRAAGVSPPSKSKD